MARTKHCRVISVCIHWCYTATYTGTFTLKYSAVKRVVMAALVSLSHVSSRLPQPCQLWRHKIDNNYSTEQTATEWNTSITVFMPWMVSGGGGEQVFCYEGWGGIFGGTEGGSHIVVQHNLARSNCFFFWVSNTHKVCMRTTYYSLGRKLHQRAISTSQIASLLMPKRCSGAGEAGFFFFLDEVCELSRQNDEK